MDLADLACHLEKENGSPVQAIIYMAKEVHETKDTLEAAQLIQSGNWAIVQAAIQGDEVNWILVRYR